MKNNSQMAIPPGTICIDNVESTSRPSKVIDAIATMYKFYWIVHIILILISKIATGSL